MSPKLRRLYARQTEAGCQIEAEIRAQFPAGTVIHWVARKYPQCGEVVEYCGHGGQIRLRARNFNSGNCVKVQPCNVTGKVKR